MPRINILNHVNKETYYPKREYFILLGQGGTKSVMSYININLKKYNFVLKENNFFFIVVNFSPG